MNIKDFYKTTKQDLEEKSKEFNFKKKQIKKMIDNAKKNGEEINNICDEIIIYLNGFYDNIIENFDDYYENDDIDIDYLIEKINNIKNIVGGNNNE